MRRVKPALTVLAALGFLSGGLVVTASPVQAAATISDNGNGTFTVAGVAGGGFDYLYLCPSTFTASSCWNSANPTGRAEYSVVGPIANTTFTAGSTVKTYPGNVTTTLPAGTYRAITNNGASLDASALVTVYAGQGTQNVDDEIPRPLIQQFGKPVSVACDASQPAGLDWSGVASGGWSESWAQWMNGGAGGMVCTRTLMFFSAAGRWALA